jgi:hypothetical protein
MTARAGDPADFPGAFAYEHTDVPPDVTLADCGACTSRALRALGAHDERPTRSQEVAR